MNMKEKRKPGFGAAMLPILVMAFVLGIGFGKFRLSVEVLLLVCSFFTVLLGLFYGTTWNEIADAVLPVPSQSALSFMMFNHQSTLPAFLSSSYIPVKTFLLSDQESVYQSSFHRSF